MLANVLPGLRDVRAPLAAGYIWLLALYLAVEPSVPKKPHGIWASLDHLRHMVSLVATGLAVSFVAYLVGSIAVSVGGYLALLTRPVERDPSFVRELMQTGSTFSSVEIAFGGVSATFAPAISLGGLTSAQRDRSLGPYGEFARSALVETVRARISGLADGLEALPETEFGLWRSLAAAAEGIRAAKQDVKEIGLSGHDRR